eukprot:TRINITY_DN307_c0_g1_i1.p1 TRINITY_DN307_c0_g1~~TRINITY_DN307_c0_g1_i1.p1  ORF type:complete len:497 (+),score=64.20 TRINITY_DN307_c0_g1_i1:325-1815(+)
MGGEMKPTQSVTDFYALGAPLGSGNYGTVRACLDLQKAGPPMACKTVAFAKTMNAKNLVHIQREIDALTAVGSHPHTVHLHAVKWDDTGVHFITDLYTGGELFDELLRRKRFEEADAADAFCQLASAVDHCHAHGVLHRDIKLENVLLSRPVSDDSCTDARPEMKLIDFGLAMILRDGETVLETAGSPFYMAPEIVQGQKYSFPADIWSLGIVLFSLLSGLLPFTGPNNSHIFSAITKAYIDLDAKEWDGVSSQAKGLVRSLLHPDPSLRPTPREIMSHPWVQLAIRNRRGSKGFDFLSGILTPRSRRSAGSPGEASQEPREDLQRLARTCRVASPSPLRYHPARPAPSSSCSAEQPASSPSSHSSRRSSSHRSRPLVVYIPTPFDQQPSERISSAKWPTPSPSRRTDSATPESNSAISNSRPFLPIGLRTPSPPVAKTCATTPRQFLRFSPGASPLSALLPMTSMDSHRSSFSSNTGFPITSPSMSYRYSLETPR